MVLLSWEAKMNEENIKLLLVTLEMSIRNLKPKDVKQSHLDGISR